MTAEIKTIPAIDPEAGVKDPAAISSSNVPAADDAESKRFTCIYFGYGSNLSPRTMKQRCPDSLFIGLAVVKGWKWIINETGYANIVPGTDEDEVYGALCFLSYRDEMALDESEGVPWLYEKKMMKVRKLVRPEDEKEWGAEVTEVEATAYVDVQRTTEGKIEKEYVIWVKKAIEDGVKCGMPQSYADKYLTKYLPTENTSQADIVMVRTRNFGQEKGVGLVPRGFASWSRG
jgi:gamma-glutamylcyclotransferase